MDQMKVYERCFFLITVSESFINDSEVKVSYKHVAPPNGRGVDGTFTILYHLQTRDDGGEIQRTGNYFAHFLSLDANNRLRRMTKHTVFALDLSNSMAHGKLNPMKNAMKSILEAMDSSDSFEILVFSSYVASLGIFNGTDTHKAIRRIRRLQPLGYSNLNEAYLQAIRNVESYDAAPRTVKQILIITDGKPTKGILDPAILRRNIGEANRFRYPIYGISLGINSDFNLIRHISSDSHGFARHIPTGRNVAKGIMEFFNEISDPILTNLAITYPENEVDPSTVVKIANTNFYSGGEAVAVGQIRLGVENIHPWVTGFGTIGPLQLPMDRLSSLQMSHGGDLENSPIVRLWAFLMVQHLLQQAEMNDNFSHVQDLTDEATDLALKFGFVTPVTSLVVRDSVKEYDASLPEIDFYEHRPTSRSYGPSELQADAPQPHRNPRYEPHIQAFIDKDLHFVITSPGMKIPLCFNVHAHHGTYLNLIRDQESGITVTSQVVSLPSHPKSTYMKQVFLALGDVNITITTDHIDVDCRGDDGNLQVDQASRTLWPFYRKNGKKHKKWIANREQKGSGQTYDRSGVHSRVNRQSYGHILHSHKDSTYRNRGLHSSRDTGLPGLQPHDALHNPLHFVMNSNIDDYLPHRSFRRSGFRPRANRRSSRHSGATHQKGQKKKRRGQGELCSSRLMWEEGAGEKYGDVLLLLKRKKRLHIIIGDGKAEFVISRSRSNEQLFLGFYGNNERVLSQKANGLLGQFVAKNITVSEATPILPSTANATVDLIVSKLNRRDQYRSSQVQGVLARRRSALDRTRFKCVEVQQPGKGLLDGRLNDYLVTCLQC
ncbi:hypothetical protein SK128_021058 [Halocaridina rubra]|uniref:VWFA domain-containing protein n=1 Tax=Halocaridina rubra TaxID=373956 RepID=A0AAN8WYT8_HALRR